MMSERVPICRTVYNRYRSCNSLFLNQKSDIWNGNRHTKRSSKGLDGHNISAVAADDNSVVVPDDNSVAVLADNSAVGPGDNSGVAEHFCCWIQLQPLRLPRQQGPLQTHRSDRLWRKLWG